MQLICDIGSGNSLPDSETAIKLIDEIIKRDTKKHEIIFKTQLFESAPPNVPLDEDTFVDAFRHAKREGYHLTSSVFDENSLRLLLAFDWHDWELPFIKIACRPDLYWLIGEIPRRIPVYFSAEPKEMWDHVIAKTPWWEGDTNCTVMVCSPKYPSGLSDYLDSAKLVGLDGALSYKCISDHTEGWALMEYCKPDILEKHVVPEHNDTNPDAGAFAVTVDELSEIL